MKAPVLGLYGADDQSITAAQIEAMKAALATAGKTAEFKIYPGAGHGFPRGLPAELQPGSGAGRLETRCKPGSKNITYSTEDRI